MLTNIVGFDFFVCVGMSYSKLKRAFHSQVWVWRDDLIWCVVFLWCDWTMIFFFGFCAIAVWDGDIPQHAENREGLWRWGERQASLRFVFHAGLACFHGRCCNYYFVLIHVVPLTCFVCCFQQVTWLAFLDAVVVWCCLSHSQIFGCTREVIVEK